MDIETINKYVLCVNESGSMNKAARILGLSQPALSMNIGNLEKKLGYQLFNRNTKPISLTAEGQIYIEYLKQHMILLEDMTRKLTDLHGQNHVNLTVGGSVVYVESLIAPLIQDFRQRFPECRVTIKSAPLKELIQETENGNMDCFISTSKEIPERFKTLPLKKERIYLVIPKAWEINRKLLSFQVKLGEDGAEMDYSILEGLPYISLLKDLPLQKKMSAFWKEKNVHLSSEICVNQVSTGLNLAFRGVGIAAASEEALLNCSYEDSVCLYTLPDLVSDQTIYAAYDAERYIPSISREFISMLKEYIK